MNLLANPWVVFVLLWVGVSGLVGFAIGAVISAARGRS